jgi:hypothetical protein
LIGGLGKFGVNARDVLFLRHQQARQVFREVAAFGFIGENRPKLLGHRLDNGGELNNAGPAVTSAVDFSGLAVQAYRHHSILARGSRFLQKFSINLAHELIHVGGLQGQPTKAG